MTKRIIAILLTLFILTFSVFGTYENAYAMTPDVGMVEQGILDIAPVLVMTNPEIALTVALLCGVAIGGKYVYDHWDSIEIAINNGVIGAEEWWNNARSGIIDTSSQVFTNIKNWAWELTHQSEMEHFINGYVCYLPRGEKLISYDANGKRIEYTYSEDVYIFRTGNDTLRIGSADKTFIRSTYYTSTDKTNTYEVTKGNGISNCKVCGNKHTWYNYTLVSSNWIEYIYGLGIFDFTNQWNDVYDLVFHNDWVIDVGKDVINIGNWTDEIAENLGVIDKEGTGVISLPFDWAIDRVIDGVLDGIIDYPSILDGIGVIPIVHTPDATYPIDITVPSTPVVSPEPFVPTLPTNSDYTIKGLEKLFPFCIPFDIYNMLKVLCADPEPPKVDWVLFKYKGQEYIIHIDLSKFNTVASIFRDCMLILFCVGLAMKTRDLIRG